MYQGAAPAIQPGQVQLSREGSRPWFFAVNSICL